MRENDSQWLVIKNPSLLAAGIAGSLDISIAFSYLVVENVALWYSLTLSLKLIAILLLQAPGRKTVSFHAYFLACFSTLLFFSAWRAEADAMVWAQAVGFCLHLICTLTLVRSETLGRYLTTVAHGGLIISLLFVVLAMTGMIENTNGRYTYFRGTHPNLGSEIIAMTVTAGGMILSFRRFLIFTVFSLLAVGLMQGRAAILVVLLVAFVRVFQYLITRRSSIGLYVSLIGIAFVTILAFENTRSLIANTFNSTFLLDDEYRGTGTGFVGRSAQWEGAWNYFLESPLLGKGFGFFDLTGATGAHSLFFYALAEFGLTSIFIFSYAGWCVKRSFRNAGNTVYAFLPVVIMAVFNDRFINLNPYPFIMIVVLLILAVKKIQIGDKK